jgi:hypothetical protein
VKGQISELPALVGTVCAVPKERKIRIASVKNRHGEADPTGRTYMELEFNGPSGQISDPKVSYQSSWTGPNYYERGEQ